MRRGDASKYAPEAAIGRPRLKRIKTPIAVRDWKCELCGEIIPEGRHYLRYYDRRPLEIDTCPYHFMCWAIINLYSLKTGLKRYTNDTVFAWAKKTYCTDCEHRCKGFHNCRWIAKAINFKHPNYPFDPPEKPGKSIKQKK